MRFLHLLDGMRNLRPNPTRAGISKNEVYQPTRHDEVRWLSYLRRPISRYRLIAKGFVR
jgi:hypothetical protein